MSASPAPGSLRDLRADSGYAVGNRNSNLVADPCADCLDAQPGIAVQAWLPASQAGLSDGAMARSRVPGQATDSMRKTRRQRTKAPRSAPSTSRNKALVMIMKRDCARSTSEARRGAAAAEVYAAQVRWHTRRGIAVMGVFRVLWCQAPAKGAAGALFSQALADERLSVMRCRDAADYENHDRPPLFPPLLPHAEERTS